MTLRRVDVGAVTLAFADEGEGAPVLLGHSLAFDMDVWAQPAAVLRARGYRTLRCDFRGHGQTGGGTSAFTLADLADDLARALDQLAIGRVAYGGISMGGMVGLRLALRHPDRVAALVLANTSGDAEDPVQLPMFDQVNEASRGLAANPATVEFLMQLMFADEFRAASPTVAQAYAAKLNRPNDDGKYFAARAVLHRDSVLAQLGRIRAPTLVVTSDGDRAIPPAHGERLHQGIAGSARLHLHGAGHTTTVERGAEVGAAMAEFLEPHGWGGA